MRHKQRPVKSSRSVTFIIDNPQTSFGDQNNIDSHTTNNNNLKKSTHNQPSSSLLLSAANKQQRPQQQQQRFSSSTQQQHHHQYHGADSGSSIIASSSKHYQQEDPMYHVSQNRPIIGSVNGDEHVDEEDEEQNDNNNATTTNDILNNPLLRKQFAHNYRHMSDVMRLAFLENNDISIDDCSKIDFNSLSTASILHRNIQQQLQQERRDQLQLRQQQQQHSHLQQQLQHHDHHRNNNHHHNHHQQQQQLDHQDILSLQQDFLDEYGNNDSYYDLSDSSIFATAGHNSSSIDDRTTALLNAADAMQQQLQKSNMNGSGGQSHRRGAGISPNSKKRTTRDSVQRVEFNNHVQVEPVQNFGGEGFLCDEPGCGKSFPSLRKLRHHKVVHSDDFPFVCEFNGCAKKFKRKFGIDLHSTTHFDLDPDMYSKTSNNSSLPFFGRRMQYSMCKPCGQKFKTVHEYQYHMLKHGKEPFKCPVKGCGQTFGIWKSFQKHRASHYFNYYCKMDPRCDHHTSNLQLLKLHIYCCHFRRKLPENATLSSKDAVEEKPSNDEPTEVATVDEEQSQQMSHMEEDRDVKVEKDDSTLSIVEDLQKQIVSTPRRDSRLRKNPPRSSTFNQQDYASINNGSNIKKRKRESEPRAEFDNHVQTETIQNFDGEGFKCHMCDYKFTVRFQLTKHLSTHLELTPDMYTATADKQVVQLSERRRREFYCDKCNVKFEHMPELDNHMRKHGQRPYVCNFCQHPSTFRLAKQYLSHLYEHRFNYKCTMTPDCDFSINRKDALKLHVFRMHLDQSLPSFYDDFAALC